MVAVWLGALVCAAVLGGGAAIAERGLIRRGAPVRAPWITAMSIVAGWPLLSSRIPPVAAWVPSLPDDSLPGWLPGAHQVTAEAWGGLLVAGWLLSTLAVVIAGVGGELRLRRRARRFAADRLTGVSVRSSRGTGPLVYGLWRPRIVLPRWLSVAPLRDRRLALVHELEHVRARDVPLIWAGFVLVAAAPWNPLQWWLYARLRQSIELDCDHRVLARRIDARRYGRLLLAGAGARRLGWAPAAGLPGGSTLLRRRLRRLAAPRSAPAFGRCLAAVAVVAVAALSLVLPRAESLREATVIGAFEQPAAAAYRAEASLPATVTRRAGSSSTPGPAGDGEEAPAVVGRYVFTVPPTSEVAPGDRQGGIVRRRPPDRR